MSFICKWNAANWDLIKIIRKERQNEIIVSEDAMETNDVDGISKWFPTLVLVLRLVIRFIWASNDRAGGGGDYEKCRITILIIL